MKRVLNWLLHRCNECGASRYSDGLCVRCWYRWRCHVAIATVFGRDCEQLAQQLHQWRVVVDTRHETDERLN